jgi:hypothetical protein
VLFIFAEAIYRSFVDQFFQLRRRGPLELRSCHLVIIRCGWRFVIGDPVFAAQHFGLRLHIILPTPVSDFHDCWKVSRLIIVERLY